MKLYAKVPQDLTEDELGFNLFDNYGHDSGEPVIDYRFRNNVFGVIDFSFNKEDLAKIIWNEKEKGPAKIVEIEIKVNILKE